MKLGSEGKAYISSDLHADLPTALTYLELDCTEAIEAEMGANESSLDNRKSRFTKYGGGQIASGFTVTLTYDPADTTMELLITAFLNRTVLGLAVMDDDITTSGTKGWLMDVEVFGIPKAEDLNEFDEIPVVFKPSAKSAYNPTRTTVA